MDVAEREAFVRRLDELGAAEVRRQIAVEPFTGRHGQWAHDWLETKDAAERAASAAAAEASSLAQIAEAREANRLAHNANIIATVALIAALIANAIAIITAFVVNR